MRVKTLVTFSVLCAALAWGRTSQATLCYMDAKADGTGLPMKWPTAKLPIPYYINAAKYTPAADKAKAIAAVQAAFASYEKVTCSALKFEYKGETTSVPPMTDAILVYFSDVSTGGAYLYMASVATYDPPDINSGSIQMTVNGFNYVVLDPANLPPTTEKKIDIQTAVTQMIPGALGFYVGSSPADGSLTDSIKYSYVQRDLTADQIKGVQYLYYKNDTGCTQPAKPAACKTGTPTGDGPHAEAGVAKLDKGGTTPGKEGGVIPRTEAGVPLVDLGPTEAGVLPQKGDDGGCCRVSYAQHEVSSAYLALVGVALFLALRRRRGR